MSDRDNSQAEEIESVKIPGTMLNRFLMKSGLAKSELQATVMSVLLYVSVTLAPLLVLSVLNGTEFGAAVEVPVHADYITLTRCLIVGPILIVSDFLSRPWLARACEQFLQFTDEKDGRAIRALFRKVFFFQNQLGVNLLVYAIAVAMSILGTSIVLEVESSTWQEVAETNTLTAAGYWNAFVSQPLFRYIVLGWLIDYCLWVYFLFRVSRYDLRIFSTHPDGVGGLSFIRVVQTQYCLPALALSASMCSLVAQTIRHTHTDLHAFTNLAIVFLVIVLTLFAAPLLVFTPKLLRSKLNGVFTYGELCNEMSQRFSDRWIEKRKEQETSILESTDPSSIADLGGAFQVIGNMKTVLIDKQFLLSFVVLVALPALPLIASVMPIEDILKQIFNALT